MYNPLSLTSSMAVLFQWLSSSLLFATYVPSIFYSWEPQSLLWPLRKRQMFSFSLPWKYPEGLMLISKSRQISQQPSTCEWVESHLWTLRNSEDAEWFAFSLNSVSQRQCDDTKIERKTISIVTLKRFAGFNCNLPVTSCLDRRIADDFSNVFAWISGHLCCLWTCSLKVKGSGGNVWRSNPPYASCCLLFVSKLLFFTN